MVTTLETMICISAIAGSVRFAKAEYDQMRRAQQINRALACAVGSWLTAATTGECGPDGRGFPEPGESL
jgi:hypothetical protein